MTGVWRSSLLGVEMTSPQHDAEPGLLPQHQALLEASAIAPAVAQARGYRTLTGVAEARSLGFSAAQARVPALLIPIWGMTGEVATHQIRPDHPRSNAAGRLVKYETPRGSRMVLDVHPTVRGRLADPAEPLMITEGIRKGDAAVSAGLVAVALLGVWNWRGTNDRGGKVALADFESIALNGRIVYLAFDSDAATKVSVARALARLRDLLASRGATVRIVRLPAGPGGAKVGLDDFLAAGQTVGDLLALADVRQVAGDARRSMDQGSGDERRSQAARLVALAADAELFHTPMSEPFATIPVDEHRETHPIRSLAFKSWLRQRYWTASEQPAGQAAMSDAVETLAARAEYDGRQLPVWVRVGSFDGRLYLDLANDRWDVVEIGPDGWRLVTDPPVRFRRSATMEALPVPARGGSLAELRPFVNLADDDAWHLFCGAMVAAFRPSGPYLVLLLHGEQGSAKSTTVRVFRGLVDPSRTPLRAEPREQQDLLIAARYSWVVAFDNLSHIPPWLSDAFCRLSTGGGLGKRQLYTDQDEIVLDAQRPLILNSIGEIATRGDLLDRAILLEQLPIPDHARRAEVEYWRAFEAVRPRILGALLDAVAAALAGEAAVRLARLPRMADAARWVTAAEGALGWPGGTFEAAYARNRREGHAVVLEASPLAGPLQRLIAAGDWRGTARELLARLAAVAGAEIAEQRDWPRNARALTEALKRLAPTLRAMGIEWTRLSRTGSSRTHLVRGAGGRTVTTDTNVTLSAAAGDGQASATVGDRHAMPATVTPALAWNDGDDDRDGPAPVPMASEEEWIDIGPWPSDPPVPSWETA